MARSTDDVFIVAPFITLKAFESVMRNVKPDVCIVVVTRWLPEELAVGVSDCRIFEVLDQRSNAKIYLLDSLHAKYFRSDEAVLIGSTNITNRALSDGDDSNFELLSSLSLTRDEIDAFEFELLREAESVTREMFESVLRLQNQMRDANPEKIDYFEEYPSSQANDLTYWLPSFSEPGELYGQYLHFAAAGNCETVSANQELSRWKPPYHLDEASFDKFIGDCIRHEPIVEIVNQFLVSQERRFGEVARFLARELSQDSRGSDEWGLLLEWLLYFLPSEYSYRRNPHSELVRYLGH